MQEQQIQEYFKKITTRIFSELKSSENLNINLIGESQKYLRFNNSLIRQNTNVFQLELALQYQDEKHSIFGELTLTTDLDIDIKNLNELINIFRSESTILPEDPFYSSFKNNGTSQNLFSGRLPENDEITSCFCEKTKGTDFTGLYAGGLLIRANKNNLGQDHWFSQNSFFIDYSLYTKNEEFENKAVKGFYSDLTWNRTTFLKSFEESKSKLQKLKMRSKSLSPNAYKVYLSPSAAAEFFGQLNHGGFSYFNYKQGTSPFKKIIEKEVELSSKVNIKENFKLGLSQQFNADGEVSAPEIDLISKGKIKDLLVSQKTSTEYKVKSNAAESSGWSNEAARCLDIAPGILKSSETLKTLNKGIYIDNLHYLNWSHHLSARITGMTRYACFWVENGEIQAPIKDLRFDVSVYDVLGKNLVDLTSETMTYPNSDTYFRRGIGGIKTPGLLTEDFEFKL